MGVPYKKRLWIEEITGSLLSLLPLAYLALEWNNLPPEISVFWNFKNNDALTPKSSLIYLCALPFIAWQLMTIPQVMPLFDSRDAIALHPDKYLDLKFVVLFALFLLAFIGVNYYQISLSAFWFVSFMVIVSVIFFSFEFKQLYKFNSPIKMI